MKHLQYVDWIPINKVNIAMFPLNIQFDLHKQTTQNAKSVPRTVKTNIWTQ